METNYILGIDQGTTSTTVILVDSQTFEIAAEESVELAQYYPGPTMVEHDLDEIWSCVEKAIQGVLQKIPQATNKILSIGISNQRETTCAFTKEGKVLAKAIVWQDTRTKSLCQKIRDKDKDLIINTRSGLPIDAYFSASKMLWLLKNNAEVAKAYKEDNLYLTTVDSFLLGKLTQFKSVATEPSNASRTLLMNLDTGTWDNDLCEMFEIDPKVLAPIQDSFGIFGITSGLSYLPDGIAISAILGDQQAALFGQCAFKEGMSKCTYGTGAFFLLNTGETKKKSEKGLISTVAYQYKSKICYALEGSSYIAGAAVKWLRDKLEIIKDYKDIEELAAQATLKEMENLLFLPFFTGIASPHWITGTQAAIVGLLQNNDKKHLARACLEGIALSVEELLTCLELELGTTISKVHVDGGASVNDLLCQIQANFGKREILRPLVIETTSYGVAMGSMIGIGELTFDQMAEHWKEDRKFIPETSQLLYYKIKKRRWMEYMTKLYL